MIQNISPHKLIDYNKNAKKHPKDQIKKLARAFKEEGFHGCVIVDENMVIIAGHGRKYAAIEAGLDSIPVQVLTGLSEEQKRSKRLGDNKLAESDWLDDILKEELTFLNQSNYDISLSGFDINFIDNPESTNTNDPDECLDENNIEIRCALGDIWRLDSHLLLVGDSTDPKCVKLLLSNDIPNLMCTDPPYGVSLDQSWRDEALHKKPSGNKNTIKNDDIADWHKTYALFTGNIMYVWHASIFSDVVKKNIEDCDFEVRQMIVWNKESFVIGRSHYHWKHEPCWYAVRRGKTADWMGDRKQTTVWDASAPNRVGGSSNDDKTEHPSQKPVLLSEIPILNHTKINDLVYDPFGGSGSTLIACEKLTRRCRMMELDPKYASLIIDRWEKYSGKKAEKIAS